MSVKIVAKDGNVVITADDGSSVSGITVDGEEIVAKKKPWRCDCSGCKSLTVIWSLVITLAMTVTIYYIMRL